MRLFVSDLLEDRSAPLLGEGGFIKFDDFGHID